MREIIVFRIIWWYTRQVYETNTLDGKDKGTNQFNTFPGAFASSETIIPILRK
jgi:hypothetical protein